MSFQILHGDCVEMMRTLAGCSVDAIVTDPPYHLTQVSRGGRIGDKGFMGKQWDGGDVAFRPETWAEALRVLKPGGHLLAFGGTRTYHRMVCAIEDAGFEIRDTIAWVYGSGFPKSLNVANAVDERRKPDMRRKLLPDEARFCGWMRAHSGLDTETVRRITGSARFMTGEVEIVNTATKESPRYGRRAMVPTAEAWARLREHMALQPPEWVEALVKEPPQPPDETPGEAWTKGKGQGTAGSNEWAGWGTALKPALEPIVVARKPLTGTVAANVLAHGTGALNIDRCRVGDTVETWPASRSYSRSEPGAPTKGTQSAGEAPAGRWPANLIHDGSDEVLACFPQSPGAKGDVRGDEPSEKTSRVYGRMRREGEPSAGSPNTGAVGFQMKPGMRRLDGGSAGRFFYCAKASAADRHDGLQAPGPQFKAGSLMHDAERVEAAGLGNNHPTVKPTDLMRYLCRLVTPPGGLVLDPFMGSGSTGRGAVLEGFAFIGIEREAEYLDIARARIVESYCKAIA